MKDSAFFAYVVDTLTLCLDGKSQEAADLLQQFIVKHSAD